MIVSAKVSFAWRDARSKTKLAVGKALKPPTLFKRIPKHEYDILKWPSHNELAEYFNKNYDFGNELNLIILENGIKTFEELSLKEDLWIYFLQS